MNKELNNIKYNTRRSKGVMMARFMRDPMVLQARIIAIQEPWANPYQETTHHLAKQSHQLLYPQANQTGGLRTRVCLLCRSNEKDIHISKRGGHVTATHTDDYTDTGIGEGARYHVPNRGGTSTSINANIEDKPLLDLRGETMQLQKIDDAIGYCMEVSTPWARYSSWANHSFTPECRETIKVIRQLRRRFATSQDNDDWHARNRKGRVIAKACCTAYRKWVKEITEEGTKGMWKIGKWARNREASSGSIILALKRPDGNLSDTS
ncbi:hypothetical protein N7526_001763 [Penicillium atrosanguineum]|nr:hypothetical protein N7526_001763 [Penicillium atrosanguineum]